MTITTVGAPLPALQHLSRDSDAFTIVIVEPVLGKLLFGVYNGARHTEIKIFHLSSLVFVLRGLRKPVRRIAMDRPLSSR